jgi:DNA repair protein RecO (recombination protein O)
MLHKTKAIILRSVKYGETSLVVTAYTELFGLQSYMVNGVRSSSKKGTTKAGYFQPASILDVVVYHNDLKNLQRIKEFNSHFLYQNLHSNIFQNAVALFIVELMTKCIRETEENPELFAFIEDALMHLDRSSPAVTANFPIFFALHVPVFFGFRISDRTSDSQNYLDLREGIFMEEQPGHHEYLEGYEADAVSHILKIMQPEDLEQVALNAASRRRILQAIETYYAYHISGFGTMRTLPVLREILA